MRRDLLSFVTFLLLIPFAGFSVAASETLDEEKLVHQIFLMHHLNEVSTPTDFRYEPAADGGLIVTPLNTDVGNYQLKIKGIWGQDCVYEVMTYYRDLPGGPFKFGNKQRIDANRVDFGSAASVFNGGIHKLRIAHQEHALGELVSDSPVIFSQYASPASEPYEEGAKAVGAIWLNRVKTFSTRFCRGS